MLCCDLNVDDSDSSTRQKRIYGFYGTLTFVLHCVCTAAINAFNDRELARSEDTLAHGSLADTNLF